MNYHKLSKRELLAGIGGGVGVITFGTGFAGAKGSDRHIVGTKTNAAAEAAKRKADSVHRELDFGDIGRAVAGQFSDEALDELDRNPNVRYTEKDGTMHAIAQTLPWGINRVDAEKVHTDGKTGGDNIDGEGGADIAIVDTGIDSDHSDLQANLGTGYAAVSSRGSYAEEWDDDNGHGTHCAGIADAVDNNEGVVGVSTGATLHAVKVLDSDGSGSFSDVADGIRWVADQKYDVGSMSLGASSGSQMIKDACTYAYGEGVLLVAAAGNSGPCTDCVGYPGAYSEVIAVSATNESDALAGYSSAGPEVELAAPGTRIYSTYAGGGYDTLSGTSMACPHVSGAGGQLMDDGHTNTEARDQLTSTAEDLGLSSNDQGNGLLDVEAAVGTLGSDPSPTVDSLSASEVETSDGDAEFDVSWSVSDSEGDLSSVDVCLLDSTGSTEDSVTGISVSDSSASGTTRLVANGDDGSGNSYTVELTVTDSNSDSTTSSASTEESEDSPTVDSLSASEVETSDDDAEFDVDWSVSDADGDLSGLDLTLTDDVAGSDEETVSVSASGSSDSGTTRLVASGDNGSGNSYTVDATVTDSYGNTGSGSTSVSETEDTSDGNNAPTIDNLSLSEDNSGGSPHAEFSATWTVSDSHGDLDTVDLTLTDTDNSTTENSTSVDVSGSDASDTTGLKAKFDENSSHTYEVELVVTDTGGNTASDTATEVEDGS